MRQAPKKTKQLQMARFCSCVLSETSQPSFDQLCCKQKSAMHNFEQVGQRLRLQSEAGPGAFGGLFFAMSARSVKAMKENWHRLGKVAGADNETSKEGRAVGCPLPGPRNRWSGVRT